MPITPFHFGPDALIKVIAPNHVSWTGPIALIVWAGRREKS